MAVDKVDVGHAPVVQRPDVLLDGHQPSLVDEPEPHHGQDVEGVPQGQ